MVCLGLGLAGCGGGLYVSWGPDFDQPPSVNLTSNVTSAAPGQTVRFAAAASDDFGVASVSLLRIEPDGRETSLATDTQWPWDFDTVVPNNALGTVRYFARAVDDSGQQGDSADVTITIP